MWRLVREGLRIYRPELLSAWTIGTFGPLAVFVALAHFGIRIDGWQALSWAAAALPAYLLGASAVAGWITIGTELGEHRMRLHALLPLSSGDLALAQLVLPSAMVLFGLPLSHAAAVLAREVHGAPAPWLAHATLDLMAAHLVLLLQLTLAAKEVTVLRDRVKAGTLLSTLGWFVLFVLFCAETVVGIPNSTLVLLPGVRLGVHNGNLAVCIAATSALAVVTAAFTVALFRRRTLVAR